MTRRHRKGWRAVLWGIGLFSLPSLGLEAQQAPSPAVADTARGKAAPSGVWKSQTTGKEYRVRVDRERFYAEWVNIPPKLVKHKAYIRSEALPSGSKWVGVSRNFLPCGAGEKPGSQGEITNWCHFVTRIEIDSVTRDKITGHGDSLRKFDCRTCRVLETGWTDFVWVPKH